MYYLFIMDDTQRIQLQQLIKTNNVEDQTLLIRDLKHSVKLRTDINNMLLIKKKYNTMKSLPSVMFSGHAHSRALIPEFDRRACTHTHTHTHSREDTNSKQQPSALCCNSLPSITVRAHSLAQASPYKMSCARAA